MTVEPPTLPVPPSTRTLAFFVCSSTCTLPEVRGISSAQARKQLAAEFKLLAVKDKLSSILSFSLSPNYLEPVARCRFCGRYDSVVTVGSESRYVESTF